MISDLHDRTYHHILTHLAEGRDAEKMYAFYNRSGVKLTSLRYKIPIFPAYPFFLPPSIWV